MIIREDDLQGPEIAELLRAHLGFMAQHTPPESIYALDLDGLRVPEITFWSAWSGAGDSAGDGVGDGAGDGGEIIGCGALRELASDHGEIKSMHAVERHRGQGVGREILQFIIAEAEARNYVRLSLETGSMDGFQPARAFYESFDFVECGPFGDYTLGPNSVYMTRVLAI